MTDPLDEIGFLAGSANRIEVLRILTDGAFTRRELGDEVDASQPTIGRVLNDLRDRDWITYDGERYRATATGALVEAGITDLRDRIATEMRLRDIVEWLPTDVIDVDLRTFRDATITTPTGTRPNAPIQRMVRLIEQTDEVLLLSHSFNQQKLDTIHARTVDGTLRTKGVFGADAIKAIRKTPRLQDRLRDVVSADSAEIRATTERVPAAVEVTDDRTHLLLRDDEGVVQASIDTDDSEVRSWAIDFHDRYWEGATPVEPGDLV